MEIFEEENFNVALTLGGIHSSITR